MYAKRKKNRKQTEVPKENRTNTKTYPNCLSATKRGKEREGCRLPSRLISKLPDRMNLPDPQTKTKLSPFSGSDQSPSDAQIRMESERAYITIRVILEPMYSQDRLTMVVYC
jgi:hypothetical protein